MQKEIQTEISHDQSRLESLAAGFAALSSQIERMSAELRELGAGIDRQVQNSLSDAAAASDAHLQETVAAAEQAARKKVLTELRAKYLKELETAFSEKSQVELGLRRL